MSKLARNLVQKNSRTILQIMATSHLKKRILVQDQGEFGFQTGGHTADMRMKMMTTMAHLTLRNRSSKPV